MRVRYLVALALALPLIIQLVWMLVVMMMALVRGPLSSCPRCMSKRTRRSVPRLSDKLYLAFLLPRRCESCKYRFYSLPSAGPTHRAGTSRTLVHASAQGNSRR